MSSHWNCYLLQHKCLPSMRLDSYVCLQTCLVQVSGMLVIRWTSKVFYIQGLWYAAAFLYPHLSYYKTFAHNTFINALIKDAKYVCIDRLHTLIWRDGAAVHKHIRVQEIPITWWTKGVANLDGYSHSLLVDEQKILQFYLSGVGTMRTQPEKLM